MNIQLPFPHWFSRQRLVLFIIIIGVLIRLPLALKPFAEGSPASWREADTASIAHNFYDGGKFKIFYPQIHWGGNGPGYVETEFQLFPFITAMLYTVFGEHPNIGRVVSLLFSVATFFMFYLLARRVLPTEAGLWALGFFVVSPLYIYVSVAFIPEPTMFFFYISALYWFLRWLDEQQRKLLLASAVCTALSILVKPTSIHLGLVFLLLLMQRYQLRFLKRPLLWLFALGSLLPATLWYLHARNLYFTYGNTFGVISGGDNKFGNLSYWLSPEFYRNIITLDQGWIFGGTIGGVVFLLGLLLYWRKGSYLLLYFGVITILLYYLILARYTEFAVSYHLYTVPYAALGVGLGLMWLFSHFETSVPLRVPFVAAGIVVVALILRHSFGMYGRFISSPNQNLIQCANDLLQFVPEEVRIIVSTTSLALDNGTPNNYQEPEIFFYSHRYGWSLPADWHTPAQVEQYRQAGAGYLVMSSDELYHANPDLMRYLALNTVQIGPGLHDGCGIFQFKANQTS